MALIQRDDIDKLPPDAPVDPPPWPVRRRVPGMAVAVSLVAVLLFLLIACPIAYWLLADDVRAWIRYGNGGPIVALVPWLLIGGAAALFFKRLILIDQDGVKVPLWAYRRMDAGAVVSDIIDVRRTYAGNPTRNVRAYTVQYPTKIEQPVLDQIPAAPALPALPVSGGPLLMQLRQKFSRSGEHLLVGMVGETPIYLRWKQSGLTAAAGNSGSGKTNTTRLIAAWHALNGGGLVLCDGHGEAADESLIQSCAALQSAYVLAPAVRADAIYATIKRIDAIGRARIEGREPTDVPLLLVIDEFTSLCRNHPKAAEIVNMLLNFGDEYRKANMQALIIGHHWRGDLIDDKLGGALRAAIGGRIIHGTAATEAKFLLKATEAQGVDRLRVGEALFFDRSADVQKIAIPFVPAEALREISYPPHPGWPWPLETPQEQQRSPRQRTLDDVRRRMEQAPREERLRVARSLALRGAKQQEIAYACKLSDEAAGQVWRSAKNGNGVHA